MRVFPGQTALIQLKVQSMKGYQKHNERMKKEMLKYQIIIEISRSQAHTAYQIIKILQLLTMSNHSVFLIILT